MLSLSEKALRLLSRLGRRRSDSPSAPAPMPSKRQQVAATPAPVGPKKKKRPVGKLTQKDAHRGRKVARKAATKKSVVRKHSQYERLYLGKNMKYDTTPKKCECHRPWIDQDDGTRCTYCGKALDQLTL